MPSTVTIFGDTLPVLADLGDGFYLVRCFESTLAIGKETEAGGMLSHPGFESESVPAIVLRRAVSEIAKLNVRGQKVEAGVA